MVVVKIDSEISSTLNIIPIGCYLVFKVNLEGPVVGVRYFGVVLYE